MRSLTFLILGCFSLAACGADTDDTLRLRVESGASAELLAKCISQDFDGVFPRFFPAGEEGAAKSFETYNGIRAEVVDEGSTRVIFVRSPHPLAERMKSYVHRCVRVAETS
ncbi:MAG: hypothetical protein KKD64_04055 [Alphaproteobacteria bacterium]|jgi:hypothetical protein|nr:hypothetical protein [Alphaproteobacteria bacterium]MBU0793782.1 hypothetical protein [Alphaproteobacteria bacterium]MBU0875057.1 hypothetical protein [Alphaproteobacteria bacterium]MBU1768806.1 hypothetical protein [Alphaproteobacteria bacterium]